MQICDHKKCKIQKVMQTFGANLEQTTKNRYPRYLECRFFLLKFFGRKHFRPSALQSQKGHDQAKADRSIPCGQWRNMVRIKLKTKSKMNSINLETGDLYNMIHEAVEDALKKQSARSASTLLTREATAKRLGVDVSTLWRWDRAGYLKSVRIGRAVHYRLSDIEARERGETINQ